MSWTEDEHRKFLEGVEKYGKGAWDRISKEEVVTKTVKQVTSHAQEYYLRLDNNNNKEKRRNIHDATIKTPTTSSSSSSVTPTPSIQDIATATTTINVQVEPTPLAGEGAQQTIQGEGEVQPQLEHDEAGALLWNAYSSYDNGGGGYYYYSSDYY